MRQLTISQVAAMGGHARAAKLTKERQSEIGTQAVTARWRKAKQEKNNNKKGKQWKRKKTSRRK